MLRSIYGSGYPGSTGRGVASRNFPFYFWPLAWGVGGSTLATAAYLHDTEVTNFGHNILKLKML